MLLNLVRINIGKYFIISCTAAIIDMALSLLLYKLIGLDYLLACNLGIVSGFIFQYFVSIRYVFNPKNIIYSLVVYIATFLMSTFMANGIMWLGFDILSLSFAISKLFSMAVPFFIMYYIRKSLLGTKSGSNSLQ